MTVAGDQQLRALAEALRCLKLRVVEDSYVIAGRDS
jgi:hypothetical protein